MRGKASRSHVEMVSTDRDVLGVQQLLSKGQDVIQCPVDNRLSFDVLFVDLTERLFKKPLRNLHLVAFINPPLVINHTGKSQRFFMSTRQSVLHRCAMMA
ncbi:hypothetical protein D3C87_1924780 [compost metagenome]